MTDGPTTSATAAPKRSRRPRPPARNMVGKTYLLAGQPVMVLEQWAHAIGLVIPWSSGAPTIKRGPQNVLIRREDGTRTVVPRRPLRSPKP